ncbi:MAG: type II toxin-antitoxin system RelE/ParE family toxin [Candidatus Binatia bacterium]
MILSFKHKGLQKFFETGSKAGIQAAHAKRLRLMLAALDTAARIDDMNIPGFNLHQLKGSRKGIWSISVSGNWRVTFKFEDGNAHIVNYEDYHS